MIQRYAACALAIIFIAGAATGCLKKAKPSVDSYEWSSGLREQIVTVVRDPSRAEQMLLVVDKIEEHIFELSDHTRKIGREYVKLNRDYNASREDYEALFARYEERMEPLTNALWRANHRLKEIATKEEWLKIAGEENSLFEKWDPGKI